MLLFITILLIVTNQKNWKVITEMVNERAGTDIPKSSLQNKFDRLKSDYMSYDMVVNQSGSGTDKQLDEVAWAELVAAHPDCTDWEKRVPIL